MVLTQTYTVGGISIYETLGIEIATHKFGIPAPNAGYIFACFGFMGVCALLRMKQLCYHFNDVQLILGGMALMIACNILLIGNQLPIWRFYAAIFCMYATGYVCKHSITKPATTSTHPSFCLYQFFYLDIRSGTLR